MRCTKCDEQMPDFNGSYYKVNGVQYPKFLNEEKGYNGSSMTHDWTEVHNCCGEEQEFDNGI